MAGTADNEALMPGTGYDDDATRVGSLRSASRSWWFRVLVIFVMAVGVGAIIAYVVGAP
jgi:hypothetical protein